MTDRCPHIAGYNGIELQCSLEAGHEASRARRLHEVCPYCAGRLAEPYPTAGLRCTTHGTAEPGAHT